MGNIARSSLEKEKKKNAMLHSTVTHKLMRFYLRLNECVLPVREILAREVLWLQYSPPPGNSVSSF